MNIYSCKGCGLEKEASLFPKDHRSKNGLNTRCKTCENSRRKRQGKSRGSHQLWTKLGMTQELYDTMLNEQQGVCAICGTLPNPDRALCVDHCHTTNKVRGLLCDKCNRILGQWKDDPATFSKAISYLQPTKAASFSYMTVAPNGASAEVLPLTMNKVSQ